MKKLVNGLKENYLINGYNFNALRCIEKTECIVSECLRPNSLYYYLLFREMRGGYDGGKYENFDEFLKEKIKTQFTLTFNEYTHFFDDLNKTVENDEYRILITDSFYEDEAAFAYNKKHHLHFVILQGYDLDAGSYIIIDQDYLGHTNFKDGVGYIGKSINMSKLQTLCCNIDNIEQLRTHKKEITGDDLKSGYYAYFRVENELRGIECNLEDILQSYITLLQELVEKAKESEEAAQKSIIKFMTVFNDKYLNDYSNINLVDETEVPEAEEVERIKQHSHSLYTQKRLFEMKLGQDETKAALMRAFDVVLDRYSIALSIIRKSIILGDKSLCESVIKYFDDISSKEIELYTLLLNVSPQSFGRS